MELDKRMVAVYNRYKQGSSQGERDTSEKILRKICLKIGITLEEFEDSMKYNGMEECRFKARKEHKTMFTQIIAKITDRFEIGYNDSHSKTFTYFFVVVSKKEEESIIKSYDFYKKKYKNELNEFMENQKKIFDSAFIHKHDLFKPTPTKESGGGSGGGGMRDIEDMMRVMDNLADGDFIPDNKTIC